MPFASPHGKQDEKWANVASTLQTFDMAVTARGARDRYNYLSKTFQSEDRRSLRKSGTEEQFTERESLLTELIEQQKAFQAKNNQGDVCFMVIVFWKLPGFFRTTFSIR